MNDDDYYKKFIKYNCDYLYYFDETTIVDWNKEFRDQLNNTKQLLCNYNLYVYSWTNYCTEELNYFTIQQFKEHVMLKCIPKLLYII